MPTEAPAPDQQQEPPKKRKKKRRAARRPVEAPRFRAAAASLSDLDEPHERAAHEPFVEPTLAERELLAMGEIREAVERLPSENRQRVLRWALEVMP